MPPKQKPPPKRVYGGMTDAARRARERLALAEGKAAGPCGSVLLRVDRELLAELADENSRLAAELAATKAALDRDSDIEDLLRRYLENGNGKPSR